MSLDLNFFNRGPAAHPETVTAPESHFRVVAPEASVRLDTDTKAWQWVNYVVKQQMPEYVEPAPMTANYDVVAGATAITEQAAYSPTAEAGQITRQAAGDGEEIIDRALEYAKADQAALAVDPVAENIERARQAAAEAQAVQASGGYSSDAFVHEYFNMAPPAQAAVQPVVPVREYDPYAVKTEAGLANPQVDETVRYWNDVDAMAPVEPAATDTIINADQQQRIAAARQELQQAHNSQDDYGLAA